MRDLTGEPDEVIAAERSRVARARTDLVDALGTPAGPCENAQPGTDRTAAATNPS